MASRTLVRSGLEGLPEAYFQPRRARFEEAAAIARRATSPDDAWESMAARGLVPHDWAPHATRRFLAPDGEATAHPPSREACAAVASDATGVATAEALALELLARLDPWGVECAPVVTWVVAPTWAPLSLRASGCGPVLDTLTAQIALWTRSPRSGPYHLRDRSKARREARQRERDARGALHDALLSDRSDSTRAGLSVELSHARTLWQVARDEHLHLSKLNPMRFRLPVSLRGVRIGGLPSPFEVIVAIYRLGYGLGPLTPEGLQLTAVEAPLVA